MREISRSLLALSLCLPLTAVTACADGGGDDDDVVQVDAAAGTPDAAPGTADAADVDAAGTADAGPDAGPASPIQQARDAADGVVDITIPTALVTYLKPAVGSDDAGFFIQKEQTGPALFIAVDPATLTPTPAVGDDVSLRVTEMATDAMLREATTIADLSVTSSGNDVSALRQDLTGTATPSGMLDALESELVTLTGTIAADFGFAGGGHVSAQLDISTPGDPEFKLRVPDALRDELDLASGCSVTLNAGPMWRFNAQAQPSAYAAADLTVGSGCPAPEVTGAVAIDATTVRVSFDRHIAPSSVMGDGSQFAITGGAGLTVTAAAVSGKDVTLTTSAQVGDEAYTVTVATTVQDTAGTALSASANTAMFTGFVTLAVVQISELNTNIASGCDLIELRAISGGSMDGFEVWERTSKILTFAGLSVATDDIIVVHIDGGDTTNCNTTSSGSETSAKDELPSGTHPQNYDAAWDWYSTDTGLVSTTNVISLYDNASNMMDAGLFTNGTSAPSVAAETQAATVAAAGQWEMIGGGVPVGGFVDADFHAHAVADLSANGSAPSGDSISRLAGTDTNTKADWTQAASSWGALNCPAAAPTASGDLVFEAVDAAAGQVTIRNKGASTIDIGAAGWNLCASFTYAPTTDAAVTVVAGSLNLAADQTVTLAWASVADPDTDLALYDSATFTDSSSMKAFAQWGASGLGRESVADTAGLWTAGDFIDLAGADGFIATGDVTASTGYTRAEAACMP